MTEIEFSDEVVEIVKSPQIREPKLYSVLVHNDDYTPFEFVIHVLIEFFDLSENVAFQTMFDAHKNGSSVCGSYIKEIAETKLSQVNNYSASNQQPLLFTIKEV